MNIFGQAVGRMYMWSIALLLILDAYSSYTLQQFPVALAFATALCAAVELLVIRYYLHQELKVPFSGIITGMIIGSVAPISAPLLAVAIACIVAVLSKAFIRVKSVNIFNPASLGMLAGLGLFLIGDEWWAASSVSAYGMVIPLSVVLVIAAYEARRLTAAVSFIVVNLVIAMLLAHSFTFYSLGAVLISINYFFALLMLVEPKTSPHKGTAQVAYGAGIGIAYAILSMSGVIYAYFISLLLGNAVYAIYRQRGRRLI